VNPPFPNTSQRQVWNDQDDSRDDSSDTSKESAIDDHLSSSDESDNQNSVNIQASFVLTKLSCLFVYLMRLFVQYEADEIDQSERDPLLGWSSFMWDRMRLMFSLPEPGFDQSPSEEERLAEESLRAPPVNNISESLFPIKFCSIILKLIKLNNWIGGGQQESIDDPFNVSLLKFVLHSFTCRR
jgi:hypothetical protein